MENTIKAWALRYYDLGLLPIPAQNKIPPAGFKWREYIDSRPSREQVASWFEDYPDGQIALVGGAVSGVVVLDCDEGGFEELGSPEIPVTWTQKTSKGHHYFFKWDDRLDRTKGIKTTLVGVSKKVDLRGWGGYVIAAPSTRSDGHPYVWLTGRAPWECRLAPVPQFVIDLVQSVEPPKKDWKQATWEPWVVELFKGVAQGEGRPVAMARLVGYFVNRVPHEAVRIIMADWNTRNSPPIPEDKFNRDLEGMLGRFKVDQVKGARELGADDADSTLILESPEAVAEDYLNHLEQRGRFEKPELPFGYAFLDSLTNGLRRKSWDVFAADVKTGKTTFVLNVIFGLLKLGKRVTYFSTEMNRADIIDKLVSMSTGIPGSSLIKGRLSSEDKQKVKNFLAEFKRFNLFIPKIHQPSIADVRKALDKHPSDVVCLDYIQHVRATHGDNRRLDIQEFCMGFTSLVDEYNVAGLLTSQLNVHRDFREKMAVIAPTLHDLPESAAIKRGARLVALMESDVRSEDTIRPVKIVIAANRFGGVGEGFINFHRETQRMTE